MTICLYKKFYSKSGEPFRLCGAGIFKASSAEKAKSTIDDWNKSGSRKNESDSRWKYEVIEYEKATLAQMDDVSIQWME